MKRNTPVWETRRPLTPEAVWSEWARLIESLQACAMPLDFDDFERRGVLAKAKSGKGWWLVLKFGRAAERRAFFGERVRVTTRDRLMAIVELRDSGPGRPAMAIEADWPQVPIFALPSLPAMSPDPALERPADELERSDGHDEPGPVPPAPALVLTKRRAFQRDRPMPTARQQDGSEQDEDRVQHVPMVWRLGVRINSSRRRSRFGEPQVPVWLSCRISRGFLDRSRAALTTPRTWLFSGCLRPPFDSRFDRALRRYQPIVRPLPVQTSTVSSWKSSGRAS